jgi:hypothetical protein
MPFLFFSACECPYVQPKCENGYSYPNGKLNVIEMPKNPPYHFLTLYDIYYLKERLI